MKRPVLALLLCAVPGLRADDRALNLPIGDPARRDRQAAGVLDGITDAAKGDTLTPPELATRLDGVKLLFVGESHTDVEFHKVQLRVIQELHKRGRQVLVGLEMYPAVAAEQAWLDRWHSDKALTEDSSSPSPTGTRTGATTGTTTATSSCSPARTESACSG